MDGQSSPVRICITDRIACKWYTTKKQKTTMYGGQITAASALSGHPNQDTLIRTLIRTPWTVFVPLPACLRQNKKHNTKPNAEREGPMIDKEDNPFAATEEHMLMATRGARLTEVVCVLGPVEGTREH